MAAKQQFAIVRNRTFSGKLIVEGVARITKALGDDRYMVRFSDTEPQVERWVDPNEIFGIRQIAVEGAALIRKDLAKLNAALAMASA